MHAGITTDVGRRALFIGSFVKRFQGWSVDESEPLLAYLTEHATQEAWLYRHVWEENDVVMWGA